MAGKSYQREKAQAAFNSFIRIRDFGEPCISCGLYKEIVDAGHYRSVGAAPELRFDEDNCHGQCRECNGFKSGNQQAYRENLIEKIGADRVDALETERGVQRRFHDDFLVIRRTYEAKVRENEVDYDLCW